MGDKAQSDATQAQLQGYDAEEPTGATPSTSVPTEDRRQSPSASPPPEAPTPPKPSALAGQIITNSSTKASPSPSPESHLTDTVPTQDAPKDPRVASLKAIFPDYDEIILYVSNRYVIRSQTDQG
jgi:hypothetical protein